MKELRDCNLLVISDRYPHAKDHISSIFVKNQIEFIKDYFKKVFVISLSPYVPKFMSHFDFMESKGRWDGYAEDYHYDNVQVFFAKPLSFPAEFSRKKRGDECLSSARKVISKNELDFDLIHAHFTYPSGYVGAKIKGSSGKRLILTVHEDRDWLWREIASGSENYLFAWRNADRIIRVNRADLAEFEKLRIEPSKLVYIPNGYSPEMFYPMEMKKAREKLNIPLDKKVLLNLAALESYKGQEYLIRAMKTIVESRPDTILYIVGKGSLKATLRSLIDECDLNERVILAGSNKPAKEITLWMNSCDLFVLSSLSEGNPTVMFEALGCGKPFIGTRVGGIPEIIIDDRIGFLVRPKDSQAMAEALLQAMDRNWSSDYILNYADQFKWGRVTKKIVDVYRDVLEI